MFCICIPWSLHHLNRRWCCEDVCLLVFLGLTRSLCVFLPRLAESRTNPQMLDIGVNPQDYNPEECLSPSNWDKAEAEAADAEDAFGFWSAVLGRNELIKRHKGSRARCSHHRRPLAAVADYRRRLWVDMRFGTTNEMTSTEAQTKAIQYKHIFFAHLLLSIMTFKNFCYFL